MSKHLSDTEMAAEWWRQKDWYSTASGRAGRYGGKVLSDSADRQWERLEVIDRFAKTPHEVTLSDEEKHELYQLALMAGGAQWPENFVGAFWNAGYRK